MSGPAAELLLVPGIGPAWAARLVESGIHDIEDLAQSEPDDLVQTGLSRERATEWIESAGDLVGAGVTGVGEWDIPSVVGDYHGGDRAPWIYPFDRARLRRARTLVVEPVSAGVYQVTGGRGVHTVGASCTCPDVADAPGGWCKHRLAVRLHARGAGVAHVDRCPPIF
jgi:hypothetical protein